MAFGRSLWMSLAAVAVITGLMVSGCSFGGSPQKSQGPSDEQIKKTVEKQMKSEDMQENIKDMVRENQEKIAVSDILESPENKKQIEKSLKKIMDSPDFKKDLEDRMKKVMDSPDVKKQIGNAVREQIMQMLQGGGGKPGGEKTQGGKSKDKEGEEGGG